MEKHVSLLGNGIRLLALLLGVCLSVPALGQSELVVWQKEGGKVAISLSEVDSVTFTAPEKLPDGVSRVVNGHNFVDLGLSSGLLWATCNVGASAPAEAGSYFAWGETAPKASYTKGNSVWMGKEYPAAVLTAEHDAATANWGEGVRMPTEAECLELCQQADWEWTENYQGTGMNGRVAKSRTNGLSIFFPAAGAYYAGGLDGYGKNGYYWSSTRKSDNNDWCCDLYYYSDYINQYIGWLDRFYGMPVRAVTK